MSMVTVGTKRDRVYQRAFDHEEARALRAKGWSYPRMAEHFGVSVSAVRRVLDPATRERMQRRSNDWNRSQRRPCRGGCGRLVWHINHGRSGYCPACLGERIAAPNVRENELRCTKCGEWKSDEEFGPRDCQARRGRSSSCRACETAARRANRRANPERERKYARDHKRKGKAIAKYVVMRKDEDGRWAEHSTVEASSRLHAIEKAADAPGGWVAVSAAHLKELEVAPATTFKVVKSEKSQAKATTENGDAPEKSRNCRVRDCLAMALPDGEFCGEHVEALDRAGAAA